MIPIEEVERHARIAIDLFARFEDVQLDYDEKSVRLVDEFIDKKRKAFDETTIERMIHVFGSFLGECVRRNYGGSWDTINGETAVRFDTKNAIFPFSKVRKQINYGSGDSILSFYQCIPIVFTCLS